MGRTPTVYNVTLTVANTEYSQVIPAHTGWLEFQCRTDTEIRYAFVSGKVAAPTAPYDTLKAGDFYWTLTGLEHGNITLYLASATAGSVVEITVWED